MKTASFFTYSGPGRVGIARYAPRNTPKGFRMFKALAPGSWFNSVSPEKYLELFSKEILGALNPQEAWDTVHELAAGAEPVILCWEKAGDKTKDGPAWCHRALVAQWFEQHLGHRVDEIGHEGAVLGHPLMPPMVTLHLTAVSKAASVSKVAALSVQTLLGIF